MIFIEVLVYIEQTSFGTSMSDSHLLLLLFSALSQGARKACDD